MQGEQGGGVIEEMRAGGWAFHHHLVLGAGAEIEAAAGPVGHAQVDGAGIDDLFRRAQGAIAWVGRRGQQ